MKPQIKSIISLFSICAVVAIALAVTNHFTSAVIKEKEQEKLTQELSAVMPDGGGFNLVSEEELATLGLPETVKEVYRAINGGYVFKSVTTGYGPGLTILSGVSPDGTVSGAVCLSSSETLGYEKTYGENFTGKNEKSLNDVALISGATKTTSAYRTVIANTLDAAKILSGGGSAQ